MAEALQDVYCTVRCSAPGRRLHVLGTDLSIAPHERQLLARYLLTV